VIRINKAPEINSTLENDVTVLCITLQCDIDYSASQVVGLFYLLICLILFLYYIRNKIMKNILIILKYSFKQRVVNHSNQA